MTTAIELTNRWQLPLAALVSQIGCVTLPKETLSKIDAGQALSDDEKGLHDSHPQVAGKLLAAIPRLEDVAEIVAEQRRPPDIASQPADLRQWDIRALGQMLLYAASEFDRQLVSGVAPAHALDALRAAEIGIPAALVEALRAMPQSDRQAVRRMIGLKDLAPGMIFDEDLKTTKGVRLVPSGQEVTTSLLVRLRTIAGGVGLVEPFRVQISV